MGLIEKMRQQKAIYWEFVSTDGAGGGIYKAPVEIDCRWDVKQEIFRDNDTGEQILSNAVVYVDRDIVLGSYLRLGELDDLDSDSASDNDPIAEGDVYRIQGWEKIGNISATKFLRKAMVV